MADQPAQQSPALPDVAVDAQPAAPKPPTVRFSADGETLPPYVPPPEVSAAGGKGRELPHEVYAARTTIVAALKREGYSRAKIARALGMSVSGVAWCIRRARETGALRRGLEEALSEIDEEAVPLAVEGLLHHLRKHDKDAVFATLQGKGLLRSFSQVKNEGGGGQANMAFQFNFVMPEGGAAAPTIAPVPAALSIDGTRQVFGVEKAE